MTEVRTGIPGLGQRTTWQIAGGRLVRHLAVMEDSALTGGISYPSPTELAE